MELEIKSRDELNALVRSLSATVSAGEFAAQFKVEMSDAEKAEVSACKALLARCNELQIAYFD